jgi:hypothetical protein
MSKEQDGVLARLSERLEKPSRDAMVNAMALGYGFIMIKRNKSGQFIVKSVLWHEIEDILTDMGVKGGFYHGRG